MSRISWKFLLVGIVVFILIDLLLLFLYLNNINNKSHDTSSEQQKTPIRILPDQKFDESGRDLIYLDSTIKNRLDFTSGLGWHTNTEGLKRHFVGVFDSIRKVDDSYIVVLNVEIDGKKQKETFLIELLKESYLTVLNLSDPQLKMYDVNTFDQLDLSQLNKLLHAGDIVHMAVAVGTDNNQTTTLIQENSMWLTEYMSIRRYNGLQQIQYELQ